MSIDVNVTNDLVIVTESSEDVVVNVSNAQGANGQGVPVGGTTNQVLKKLSGTNYDTYWAVDNEGVPYSGASGNVNLGAFTLTAASLIKSGGTSSQFLKADGSVDSSTYQAALTLTTTGTSGAATFSSNTLNIPQYQAVLTNPVTGTGATGQVAYWTGTSSQAGNNGLFWDAANARLGIGTNAPSASLHIVKSTVNDALLIVTPNNNTSLYPFFLGGSTLTADNYLRANASVIEFFRNGVAATIRTVGSSNNLVLQSSSDLLLNTNGSNERVRIFTTTGNVGINTGATDGGQRLQVMGDAFIKGSGATFSTVSLQVQNSAGTNLFRVYNSGQLRLGNTGSSPLVFPQADLGTVEDLAGRNLSFYSYTGSQSASSGRYFFGGENMVQTTGANFNIYSRSQFFPTSGTATLADIYINPQISQSGGANGVTRGLHVNPILTAAADWRSIEWSNNSGWGLYGAGTADNYLRGKLLINTTTVGTFDLDVNGTARVSGAATFSSDVTINGVFRETVTANRQTGSYSIVLTDSGKLVEMNVATANNLTVPLNSSIAFPIGTKIDVAQYGAGQTTLVATGGVTVRSAGGALKLAVQYSGASLVKIGTDEWYLFGDITV